MASLNSYQKNSTTTTTITIIILLIIIVLLPHLFCPVSSFNQPHPAIPPRDQLFEEKNRLGSIPPTCHNKCNQCHPCMAVQVPNSPNHDKAKPGLNQIAAMEGFFLQGNNRYSNYKPLSWKCQCGDHFYNP